MYRREFIVDFPSILYCVPLLIHQWFCYQLFGLLNDFERDSSCKAQSFVLFRHVKEQNGRTFPFNKIGEFVFLYVLVTDLSFFLTQSRVHC